MRFALAVFAFLALARPAHAEPTALLEILDRALGGLEVRPLAGKAVLVDEVTDRMQLLSLHDTHPSLVRDGLAIIMGQHRLRPMVGTGGVRDPEIEAPALLETHPDVDGILLFKLDSQFWGKPHLRIWVWTRGAGSVAMDLDPENTGLLSISWWRIGLIALLVALPTLLLSFRRRPRTAVETPAMLRAAEVRPKRVEPRKHEDGVALSEGALALMAKPTIETRDPIAVLPETTPPPPVAHTRTKQPPGSIRIGDLVPVEPPLIRDRYRVIGELGRGAMGIVYRAHDNNLEREVAIKVIGEQMRGHPDAMRLFASEAKTLAQLNHPNIVAVYDQFSDRDEAILVMELIDGTPLDIELVKRERFGWREALALIDKLLAALSYAHGKSVIHRDVKPPNIFLLDGGELKLADFGLARVVRELSIRRTEVRGTPLYMAPEQIAGENIDLRTDLYAVGMTLFELIAGRTPFLDGEILYMQVNTVPPRLDTIVPDVPPAVTALVASLIAKAPDERPPTARAVRETIAAILKTA